MEALFGFIAGGIVTLLFCARKDLSPKGVLAVLKGGGGGGEERSRVKGGGGGGEEKPK
ncbi:MAG: hypothetical protein ACRCV9_03485 [Burkholderiaceae bacterium]